MIFQNKKGEYSQKLPLNTPTQDPGLLSLRPLKIRILAVTNKLKNQGYSLFLLQF